MKTIGLLGGMSWESTASYYKTINKGVKKISGWFALSKNLPCLFNKLTHRFRCTTQLKFMLKKRWSLLLISKKTNWLKQELRGLPPYSCSNVSTTIQLPHACKTVGTQPFFFAY